MSAPVPLFRWYCIPLHRSLPHGRGLTDDGVHDLLASGAVTAFLPAAFAVLELPFVLVLLLVDMDMDRRMPNVGAGFAVSALGATVVTPPRLPVVFVAFVDVHVDRPVLVALAPPAVGARAVAIATMPLHPDMTVPWLLMVVITDRHTLTTGGQPREAQTSNDN